MFGIDDLIMGGISAISSAFNTSSNNQAAAQRQQEAESFNAEQAQINRDYQTQMSNSAYTRAAADMKNAGLNPILAAGASASSPSGNSASITAGGAGGSGVGDAVARGISTAIQSKQVNAQVDLQKQQLENTKYSADNIQADTASKTADVINKNVQTRILETDNKLKNAALIQELAKSSAAKTDKEFYDSPAGKIARIAGTGGQELGKAAGPIGDLVSSAVGLKRLMPKVTTRQTDDIKGNSSYSTQTESR